MNFKEFNNKIKEQFTEMCSTGKLFRANISGDELWNTYLSSFKDEKIFRDPTSSTHNCNCCKNFIRRYGNIVAIDDNGNLISIFSGLGDCGEYTNSAKVVSKKLESSEIKDVFFETYNELNHNLTYEKCNKNQEFYKLGVESNFKQYSQDEVDKFGVVNVEKIYEFNHFQIDLPKQFVDFSGKSIEQITAFYRDKYSVFKRAMEEIPLDTLNLVKDLINQGSLLDGAAHLHSIHEIISFKFGYNETKWDKSIACWAASYLMEERTAKFKNTLIGVLCTELAEGMELNKACENWNKRVDPVNYHKATAPITKRQIEEARKFVEENDYTESFNRRLATIDDIAANEIQHMNVGDGGIVKPSLFDSIKPSKPQKIKQNNGDISEISIDDFLSEIAPKCSHIEVLLENRMSENMCALTTSLNKESKGLFKWGNNFSWTFNGNLAGKSQIKEAVKSAGGKVDGVLRFSIMWADNDGDNSDLDAHCNEPNGNRIYFSKKKSYQTGGWLDIDITSPSGKLAVENISYPSLEKMSNGKYLFRVHQFAARSSKGFKAEIEFNGEIFNYEYNSAIPSKNFVDVAEITLKNGELSISHKLPEINQSKEIWGLNTNEFHQVSLMCLSPNHWGDNSFGNKHYMFMIKNCKPNTQLRSFHNENLNEDLLKHRKVMEVLASTTMVESEVDSLAGLGFNATVRDDLIIKTTGEINRMYKIKF